MRLQDRTYWLLVPGLLTVSALAGCMSPAAINAALPPPRRTVSQGAPERRPRQLPERAIGPEDVVAIAVDDLVRAGERFELRAVPGSAGALELPEVGRVHLVGRGPREVEAELLERLQHVLRQPRVEVRVRAPAPRSVAVCGAVLSPHALLVTSPISAARAIALAGGTTPEASGVARVLTHRHGCAQPRDHAPALLRVPLAQAGAFQLAPGDVVEVLAAGSFRVEGAVRAPGAYRLRDGLTALGALRQAGGLEPVAATVAAIHRDDEHPIRLDLAAVVAGEEPDPDLRDGDTLVVEPSPWRELLGWIGAQDGGR